MNINEKCLKEKINNYKIEELKRIKNEIINCSNAYKDIFNGAPFYENWTLDSALQEINSYINDNAIILISKYDEKIVGFLVAINKIPENQKKYFKIFKDVKFIEEIGVINKYRKKGIASEMVRILLLNYLNRDDKYLAYRTNAMRYFEKSDNESFESAVLRVQEEDKIKRINNERINIPKLNFSEKQSFINKYINLINNRPDLDVSNSNALFRSIFGKVEFSVIDNNYAFQKDPTGEDNDRIFPIINLTKVQSLVKRDN